MMKDHVKLVQALSVTGEVIGRKKLQKMIFIAKKLNYPFHEKYQFHFFGPYSEELTLRIEELCNMGFLLEEKEKKSGYTQYRYRVTEAGELFSKENPSDEIPEIEACLRQLNTQSSRFLELVSTILYFDGMEENEKITKVKKVKSKQNYTDDELKDAFTYVEKMKVYQCQ